MKSTIQPQSKVLGTSPITIPTTTPIPSSAPAPSEPAMDQSPMADSSAAKSKAAPVLQPEPPSTGALNLTTLLQADPNQLRSAMRAIKASGGLFAPRSQIL
jgi:hypothetical protein